MDIDWDEECETLLTVANEEGAECNHEGELEWGGKKVAVYITSEPLTGPILGVRFTVNANDQAWGNSGSSVGIAIMNADGEFVEGFAMQVNVGHEEEEHVVDAPENFAEHEVAEGDVIVGLICSGPYGGMSVAASSGTLKVKYPPAEEAPEEKGSTFYVATDDEKVLGPYTDIETAKEVLMQQSESTEDETPKRLIAEVLSSGSLVRDPHVVDGQDQGQSISAGFNKYWGGWDDINNMMDLVQAFLDKAEEEPAEEEPAEEEPAEEEPAEEDDPDAPPLEVKEEDDVYTAAEACEREVDEGVCEDAAKLLRKAMKGFGTNEDKIITATADKSFAECAQIKASFAEQFDRDLIKDLKSECGGSFEKVLVGLYTDPAEYDASIINDAMKGFGTNETLLAEVLCTRSAVELKSASEAYERLYEKDILTAIEGETSGNFEKLCVLLLEGNQDDNCHDDEEIENDVEKLYRAGEKKFGTDEGVFIRLLAGQPREYTEKLYWAYAEAHGKSLARVIRKEFSGKLEKALVALVTPLDVFFADLFHEACDGMGTDDTTLIRLMVSQKERGLRKASARYLRKQEQSLKARVKSECSGDYENIMVGILDNWGNLA